VQGDDPELVTVIIAAYNAQDHIARALESCTQQTYRNLEVIVVDDGSTDQTSDIVTRFTTVDPRFSQMKVPNGGPGRARNLALAQARGVFVTVLDADDELKETGIARMVSAARRTGAEMVVGEWITANAVTGAVSYRPLFGGVGSDLLDKDEIAHLLTQTYYSVAKLYRLDALTREAVRYGEGYIYEDMEFLVGATLTARAVMAIPDPVYTVHVVRDSATRSHRRGDWHATSFARAIAATTALYGPQLLDQKYRRAYVTHLVGRIGPYARARIPARCWPAFGRAVFAHVTKLVAGDPSGLPGRPRLALHLAAISPLLATAVLAATPRSVIGLSRRFARTTVRELKAEARSLLRGGVRRWARRRARRLGFDDSLVFLHGFDGQIRGNTKYVLPALVDAGFEVVVAAERPGREPRGVKVVAPWSPDFHYYADRARFHLLETWAHPALEKRPGAIWCQLWHGTPIKRLLLDSPERDVLAHRPDHRVRRINDAARWDLMIAQNTFSREKFATSLAVAPSRIAVTGYPREDVLHDAGLRARAREHVRAKYTIADGLPLLLYATTWRDYNQYTTTRDHGYLFDWSAHDVAGRFEIIYAGHPFGKDRAPSEKRVSKGDDFQDLLAAADYLLTDYSSAVFDYLALDRPFCLFMKDFEAFEATRGVYREVMEDFAPFVATTERQALDILLDWPGPGAIGNRARYAGTVGGTGSRVVAAMRAAAVGTKCFAQGPSLVGREKAE